MHACEPSRASRCRAWVESNRAAMPLSLQEIAPYLRPQSGNLAPAGPVEAANITWNNLGCVRQPFRSGTQLGTSPLRI